MKKFFALLLIAALTFSLVACGKKEEQGEGNGVLKIGTYMKVSGSTFAEEAKNSFELAIEDYGGKVNGEEIEIVWYDSQANADEAVKGVKYLIGEDVDLVITSQMSSEVLPTLPILTQEKLVTMVVGTADSVIDPVAFPYAYRCAPNGDANIPAHVANMVKLGYKNCAIFYGQDEASMTHYETLKPLLAKAGISVVAEESGTYSDTDFSSQCMKIVAANPEVVYVASAGAGANFCKQLREYGYDGLIFNRDEFTGTYIDTVGAANAANIVSAISYTTYNSLEEAKACGAKDDLYKFLERYYKKTGTFPTGTPCFRYYDAMTMLLEACKRAGTNHDNEAIKAELEKMNDLVCLCGKVDFTDGEHECAHEFWSVIIKDSAAVDFEDWLKTDYEDFKAKTGRER